MLSLALPASILLTLPMAQDKAETQTAEKAEIKVIVKMQYLLALPRDYEKKDQWPLVLFLHGAGERGDDLERVKVHGPPKLIANGKDFPFITVSPQCPRNRWWDASQLNALVTHIEEKYHVDPDRIYVTGLSMGGFGTFSLAAYAPERFAAIAPVCGGGDAITARRIKDIPAWVFHGGRDNVVPEARSKEMVEAIRKRGGKVEYTVYPDAGHDSWTETYNNPKFYEWLLKQKRTQK